MRIESVWDSAVVWQGAGGGAEDLKLTEWASDVYVTLTSTPTSCRRPSLPPDNLLFFLHASSTLAHISCAA